MWLKTYVMYDLNNEIRKKKVIKIKDYIVLYGVSDDWIEAMNLRDKTLLLRVEFEPVDGIEMCIKNITVFPINDGWDTLNEWLEKYKERSDDGD